MKLTDILELAKQGYKPSDIRELIEISEATEAKEAEQKTADDDQQHDEADAPEETSGSGADEDPIDYKALYEAEKDKTAKLQNTLRNVDMSGDDPEADLNTVLDAARSFM